MIFLVKIVINNCNLIEIWSCDKLDGLCIFVFLDGDGMIGRWGDNGKEDWWIRLFGEIGIVLVFSIFVLEVEINLFRIFEILRICWYGVNG